MKLVITLFIAATVPQQVLKRFKLDLRVYNRTSIEVNVSMPTSHNDNVNMLMFGGYNVYHCHHLTASCQHTNN